MVKTCNILARFPIYGVLPVPIHGTVKNLQLTPGQILLCMNKGGVIDQILSNGKIVRLNLSNYNYDFESDLAPKIYVESSINEEEIPVATESDTVEDEISVTSESDTVEETDNTEIPINEDEISVTSESDIIEDNIPEGDSDDEIVNTTGEPEPTTETSVKYTDTNKSVKKNNNYKVQNKKNK